MNEFILINLNPNINLYFFLTFFIGLIGIVINKNNLLMFLICIEILLFSVNILFIIISFKNNDIMGQIFVFIILTIAAAEASIILAIIILTFKIKGNIDLNKLNFIKG